MMDLDSLRCSVQRNGNFHFSYTLHMKYKNADWYMEKSFGDFEQLQESLIYNEFADVPLLPDLQVSGSIDPLVEVRNAEEELEAFIREVLRRPDTRSFEDTLIFCDLLRRLPKTPEPVVATLVADGTSCHLSVSDVCYLKVEKLLIVSYEEKTVLSKIGRMWSIIDQENLGAIRVYKICDDVTEGVIQLLEKLFHSKIRGIDYIRDSSTLVVAKDDGHVEMFRLNSDATEFESIGSIMLHAAPILAIGTTGGIGFTSGYDDNIRAFDIASRATISGGKLTKRLSGDKLLTSTVTSPRTMMIGTSANRVYTYYMKNDIPIFVDSCTIPQPMNIRRIHCTANNVFVAHGNCVSCFGYSRYSVDKLRETAPSAKTTRDNAEREMTGITRQVSMGDKGQQQSQSDTGMISFPMSIRSAQFSVNKVDSAFSTYQVYDVVLRAKAKQLLVAYDEVVAVWCIVKGVILYSWYAHRNAQVHVLRILDPDDLVLTGGSDGEIRIWRLPDASLLRLWNPVAA